MLNKIKLIYLGSPQFSAFFLEKILTDKDLKRIISIEFIVTQPDKPVGRKQILTPTPVKQMALKYQISNIKYQKDIKNLNLKNIDIALVYAYSQIIPKELLDLPKYGFWCIHPSLLPKYRGPSPIVYTLLNGDKKTGVTIFKMDEKIDHGPIIAQKSLTILPTDYRVDLEKKLTDLGFELFKEIITKLIKSQKSLSFKYQNNNLATYTRILKKDDGYIKYETLKKLVNNEKTSFEELPEIIKENYKNKKTFNLLSLIFNFFKALYPWPGVWTILPNGKRLKIIELSYTPNSSLNINKVQLEGKKQVDFKIFKKAYGFF